MRNLNRVGSRGEKDLIASVLVAKAGDLTRFKNQGGVGHPTTLIVLDPTLDPDRTRWLGRSHPQKQPKKQAPKSNGSAKKKPAPHGCRPGAEGRTRTGMSCDTRP